MANNKIWPVAVVAILALVVCTGIILWSMPAIPSTIEAKVDNSALMASIDNLNTKVNDLSIAVSNIPTTTPTIEAPTIPSSEKIDQIYNEVLDKDLKTVKAEELINEEITSRDFKKAIKKAIVSYCEDPLNECDSDIEDYKDITDIVISDIDTRVRREIANSEVILKVYYFVDGDEEEIQKAKISVTFEVTGLDPDEDYIDAEVVDEYEPVVVKVYK